MKTIIKKHKLSEMELGVISVLSGFFGKAATILSTCWGWVSLTLMAFMAFIAPITTMLWVLLAIVGVDTLLGIWINRKKIQSSKLRNVVIKSGFYMLVLILAFSLEAALGIFILVKVLFALCSLVELISVISNMAIILPNVKVFSLIKKLLKDEISKKTNLAEDIIENVLEKSEKENTKS